MYVENTFNLCYNLKLYYNLLIISNLVIDILIIIFF
jgi:hypothetical protein